MSSIKGETTHEIGRSIDEGSTATAIGGERILQETLSMTTSAALLAGGETPPVSNRKGFVKPNDNPDFTMAARSPPTNPVAFLAEHAPSFLSLSHHHDVASSRLRRNHSNPLEWISNPSILIEQKQGLRKKNKSESNFDRPGSTSPRRNLPRTPLKEFLVDLLREKGFHQPIGRVTVVADLYQNLCPIIWPDDEFLFCNDDDEDVGLQTSSKRSSVLDDMSTLADEEESPENFVLNSNASIPQRKSSKELFTASDLDFSSTSIGASESTWEDDDRTEVSLQMVSSSSKQQGSFSSSSQSKLEWSYQSVEATLKSPLKQSLSSPKPSPHSVLHHEIYVTRPLDNIPEQPPIIYGTMLDEKTAAKIVKKRESDSTASTTDLSSGD